MEVGLASALHPCRQVLALVFEQVGVLIHGDAGACMAEVLRDGHHVRVPTPEQAGAGMSELVEPDTRQPDPGPRLITTGSGGSQELGWSPDG
jgi:hypothetical protein